MKSRGYVSWITIGLVLWSEVGRLWADLARGPEFEFGATVWYLEYKEPGLMTEKGPFAGFDAAYTYRGPSGSEMEDILIRSEVRVGFGLVDYDGQLMDGTPYSYNGQKSMLIEPRILIGRDVAYAEVHMAPYVGVGYRRLDDYQSGDPAGYDRSSNYLYSPVGLETWAEAEGPWRIGGTLEYDLFWGGRQETWLFDPPLRNHQHAGYGVRGSLKFVRKGPRSEFVFEPYVVYWSIKTSDVVYGPDAEGYVEPANHSVEIGLRVGIWF